MVDSADPVMATFLRTRVRNGDPNHLGASGNVRAARRGTCSSRRRSRVAPAARFLTLGKGTDRVDTGDSRIKEIDSFLVMGRFGGGATYDRLGTQYVEPLGECRRIIDRQIKDDSQFVEIGVFAHCFHFGVGIPFRQILHAAGQNDPLVGKDPYPTRLFLEYRAKTASSPATSAIGRIERNARVDQSISTRSGSCFSSTSFERAR